MNNKDIDSKEQVKVEQKSIDLADVTIYASYEVEANGKYVFSADD